MFEIDVRCCVERMTDGLTWKASGKKDGGERQVEAGGV